jgi:glycine cleavage system aminomethyltransferase T
MDVTMTENPYSAGLGFCVRMNKGEFIGRTALAKIKEQGITQRLCTLLIGGEDYLTIYGGEAVLLGSEVVGRLRSSGYGFTVKRNRFAYLPMAQAKAGTKLEVEVRKARHGGSGRRRSTIRRAIACGCRRACRLRHPTQGDLRSPCRSSRDPGSRSWV